MDRDLRWMVWLFCVVIWCLAPFVLTELCIRWGLLETEIIIYGNAPHQMVPGVVGGILQWCILGGFFVSGVVLFTVGLWWVHRGPIVASYRYHTTRFR